MEKKQEIKMHMIKRTESVIKDREKKSGRIQK